LDIIDGVPLEAHGALINAFSVCFVMIVEIAANQQQTLHSNA
jgi:hypothetical protein